MSELLGTLVFHTTTKAVANCLQEFSEETSAEAVLALIKAAGVTVSDEDFPLLFDTGDDVLFAEDIDFEGEYVVIKPFGEEWLEMLKTLSRSDSLSFWARLQHEHGTEYFMAVSGQTKMMAVIDEEEGELEDDEIAQIEKEWRSTIPHEVLRYFGDSD